MVLIVFVHGNKRGFVLVFFSISSVAANPRKTTLSLGGRDP